MYDCRNQVKTPPASHMLHVYIASYFLPQKIQHDHISHCAHEFQILVRVPHDAIDLIPLS